jgi:hypothetical protein
MGSPSSRIGEQGRVVSGILAGSAAAPVGVWTGRFNLTVSGSFVGGIAIERSFDGGSNWHNCTLPNGAPNSWTSAFSVSLDEPEPGVLYRLNPALSSGNPTYRVSGAA